MLQIKDIRKQYITGELVQTALDGVSLTLRDNEFVAILGPSGSGKTTMLNVIGGLDRYDSGDLIINGISTKKYSDRDWDSYRNHTIGFVFQSYNLIPHQTVQANVELALTISGISRSERRRRAKEALEAVGLGNQLHKKPNQMSGGQMQRVAIARALVNNPDILLADEPTGALDSETSVQIMELLKEVARDRLVVMVTHNPELAEEYANRIVRVKDGKIVGDTNPYQVDSQGMDAPKHKNMGRASMSFFTALSLSFNNLKTKKARTLLTAFAGSIGIIGIALILSLSTGFQRYIDKIQEDTLSNYPLSIQSETADMSAAMAAFGSALAQAQQAEEGTVREQQMISQMFAQIGSNDLAAFKAYLEENFPQVANHVNAVKYSYGIKPQIYSADTADGAVQVNPANLFGQLTGSSAMSAYMDSDVFQEMLDNTELLSSQFEVIRGRWPENYDELVVVLSSPNQISDYMAYTLGLRDKEELTDMIQLVMQGKEAPTPGDPMQWSYDQLMDLRFKLVGASDRYSYNEEYRVWEDMSEDEAYMRSLVDGGVELKVVGIVCPKEGASATAMSAGVAYTRGLTEYVIARAGEAKIVSDQLKNPTVDVFTGKGFDEKEESSLRFEDMISVDGDLLSSAFGMNVSADAILSLLEQYLQDMSGSIFVDTQPAQNDFTDTLGQMATEMLQSYIRNNALFSEVATLYLSGAEDVVDAYLADDGVAARLEVMAGRYSLSADTLRSVYRPLLAGVITNYVAQYRIANSSIGYTAQGTADVMDTDEAPGDTASETQPTAPGETIPETQPTISGDTVPETQPAAPGETIPETQPAIPEETTPITQPGFQEIPVEPPQYSAPITMDQVETAVAEYLSTPAVSGTAAVMAAKMCEAEVYQNLLGQVASFGNLVMGYIGSSFYVDEAALSSAFQFNMNEEELKRLMEAMSTADREHSREANLRSLGYADPAQPSAMSIYFVDFAGKEAFLDFLDCYNADMEAAGLEDQVISYTDMTGIMMSSVRTIIDSVSYVLIAFVAVSLVVSSIMIGIITYISVMERTKEIGVLRAIGASKRNISQVFNAETFIIGMCSGLLGVGISLALIVPINEIIHTVAETTDINAQLPMESALALTVLSVILTLIGGLIPSKQAAKKDPVIALRSE